MAIVVIAGGIDLSIASMMAVCGVAAAVLMESWGPAGTVPALLAVLALGLLMGAVNGALIVLTRVPDIVVTLSMLFVWEGTALLILSFPTWLLVLRAMPLYLSFMLGSVIHVTIPLAAWLCLGEEMPPHRWGGIALVCAGIAVIARPASRIEEKT